MSNLAGRVVLITGAAGGLGQALASRFAAEGCSLALLDCNVSAVEQLAEQLTQAGHQALACPADVAKRGEIVAAVGRVVDRYGRIDVLVNNAAISKTKPMLELDEADWDEMLNINVKGVYFALQAVCAHMPRGGSIVNIASVAGRVGRPTLLHYAASKAAVISMTRSAAAGLASQGIRVNAVAPGMIDTDMFHRLQQSWGGNGTPTPGAQTLMGRPAVPDEVASTVLFLASDASAYTTGQTINVCGGIVMS
jgi:NAD(P)-dependent dehydrogenase (short-subunit alcohol dehydrogenase family)